MTPKNKTAITSDAQQEEINSDFGIFLLKALTLDQNNSTSSFVFSPISLLFVLSQLNLGAKNKTAEEIAKIFGQGINVEEIAKYYGSIIADFQKMEQEQHANNMPEAANNENVNGGLFLLPKFQRISKRCFGNDCFGSWITKADVSSNNPENLAMTIKMNEYSLIEWTYRGDAKERPFFLSEGNSKMIDQIHCKEKIGYFEDNRVKVIRFGVKGRDTCFGVILPKGHFALDNLLQSIDGKTVRKWMKSAANETKVEFRLPKFKTELIHRNLDRALKSFGLETMFESNTADFSGMSSEKVWVESVLQKAYFKLDGMEMEAPDTLQNVGWPDLCIGCVIECVDAIIPAKQFIADYPFLYVLIDKNDNLLSAGVFRGN